MTFDIVLSIGIVFDIGHLNSVESGLLKAWHNGKGKGWPCVADQLVEAEGYQHHSSHLCLHQHIHCPPKSYKRGYL